MYRYMTLSYMSYTLTCSSDYGAGFLSWIVFKMAIGLALWQDMK